MVLGLWGEGEYGGEAGPGAPGGQGSRSPGEDGGLAPLTGPGHGTGHIAGAARLQGPQDADVGHECEGRRRGVGTRCGGQEGAALKEAACLGPAPPSEPDTLGP